ncbi:MAG TPA: LuxR C-terminal-related transcriptional regulator [Gaiellaceae bacterium]|nr:LuxR C-terminal-related transcriptional regulator [Gaiellaceae bacterium]
MGVHSHEALYVCDESMTIVEWNEAAETLTGIPAAEAVGQKCWRVLRGRSATGAIVCHPGCSTGRHVRSAWPTGCGCVLVATPAGRKPLHISTIIVRDDDGGVRAIHPMHNGIELADEHSAADPPPPTPLTPRQLEVLEMLAHGMRARSIAAELHLAEATVRNHIRAVRRELGTHSQLEAVATARRAGLIS